MDLSELHRVQRQERSTDSLQELRESFYADVAEYIESLREERSAAAAEAEDPFRSARVSELSKEIETAEHVAEAIYQRRIGKLVDEASLSATGNGGDKSGLTAEEQDLYDDLVERITANKTKVLERFAGERTLGEDPNETEVTPDSQTGPGSRDVGTEDRDEAADPTPPPDEPISESETSPAEAMGPDLGGDTSEEAESDTDEAASDEANGVDRMTVRMTSDVGEIFGVDARSYDLKQDDIVDLPRENADPLLDRDAAERIE
jgi:DNA replication factor GINS